MRFGNMETTECTAEQSFKAAWPAYEGTSALDALRATEYSRLDRLGHVYLDYTGSGLYAACQVSEHHDLLASRVFGNPHSENPTSATITALLEQCRRRVLDYFRASDQEYAVIFTPNASGALKLVGEAYPFSPDGHFLLTFDNHNSVNGIREFARPRHSAITYVPLTLPEMRVDTDALANYLKLARPGAANLFAYPAQSNFSGVQHPLEWIPLAQAMGWDVLLDAAAFVPMNHLDLSQWHPDFVSISFYKMFGYPTGVGCLLARRAALGKLRRPWFAGGTITVASVQGDRYFLAEGASAFEDGTPDFLAIPAVEIGLRHLEKIRELAHTRCRCLTAWVIRELMLLQHANGRQLIRVYGPLDERLRGATLAMNFYDASETIIDHQRVEEAAAKRGISLRSGCFCNPGGAETALQLSQSELIGCFREHGEENPRFTREDFRHCVDSKGTGAVRISLGIVSNFADVRRFVELAREFLT